MAISQKVRHKRSLAYRRCVIFDRAEGFHTAGERLFLIVYMRKSPLSKAKTYETVSVILPTQVIEL